MKPVLSLRARLLVGAAFWSVGLLVLSSIALSLVFDTQAGVARHVHRALQGMGSVVFAIGCLVAGIVNVRRGLSGVDAIRQRLSALHTGAARRLDGQYPSEVQPLVDDLNVLLDQRDQAVARAIAKAGDLAHGLKTPLAVVAHEADQAAGAGATDVAASIHQQVDRMRRQLDHHLAHARAASGRMSGVRTSVRGSIDGLVRALLRLHGDRRLTIDTASVGDLPVVGQRLDVDEILGNVLDNACRFAVSTVRVTTARVDERVDITIDDDGPGLDPALRETVLKRGVRADESGPGSGFGLSIVSDLVELYGGAVTLDRSPLGGLRVTVRLPG